MKIRIALFSSVVCLAASLLSLAAAVTVEIRFHGNFTITDEEMARLAGFSPGNPTRGVTEEEIKSRLMRSGRFEWVRVTKRYRSLTSTEQVVLLVTVKEKVPVKNKLMFMPILGLSDEYGFTYGGRFTFVDLLGARDRISFPLTWGGERQAAVEGRFDLDSPALDYLFAGAGINWKENPHFELGDLRRETWGGASKRLFQRLQFDFKGGWTGVDFGDLDDSLVTYGLDLRFDTRQNIIIPRDAVYAGVGWERMSLPQGRPAYNRYKLDLRGYKGLFGQTILAGQFYYHASDGRLPDYQRPFLGGANTLRGTKAGEFVGDNMVLSSIELRAPLTSPRHVARAGVGGFVDVGAVYEHGRSLGEADFKFGAGVSFFLFVAGYGIKMDLASDFDDSFRVHFSTGFRF